MAKTISELEKERAELLKKIEQEARQAKQAKQNPTTPSEGETGDISLNDFLRAAQEVIPDDLSEPRFSPSDFSSSSSHSGIDHLDNTERDAPSMAKKSRTSADTARSASTSPAKKTNSLFTVLIIATLSLTFSGVLGLVYVTFNQQLEQLSAQSQETQVALQGVQKQLNNTGKGEGFDQLKAQVAQLEIQLDALKQQVEQLKTQPPALATPTKIVKDTKGNIVLTPEAYNQLLDQKLASYTHRLEQKLDHKINLIIQLLQKKSDGSSDSANVAQKQSKPYVLPKAVKQPVVTTPKVQTPTQPAMTQTAQPANPSVKAVATSATPSVPVAHAPKTPKVTSVASQWLLSQPPLNFTLQLASMTDEQAIQKIKQAHHLEGAKIIPQNRAGEKRYVLVLGSYPNRTQASAVAQKIKTKTGIAPWVRRVKDIAKYAG